MRYPVAQSITNQAIAGDRVLANDRSDGPSSGRPRVAHTGDPAFRIPDFARSQGAGWTSPHGQHRARRGTDDPFRDAAQEQMRDAGPTVRAHHDQIDVLEPGVFNDFEQRVSNFDDAPYAERLALVGGEDLIQSRSGILF